MGEEELRKAKHNAERDLHKHFAFLGLSLPVDIESVHHELSNQTTHWVRPSTWIKTLLKKAPNVLMGEKDHTLQCESFWALYKQHEPSAAVFEHRSDDELRYTLPILIFGDEGRGAKRGNFLVWTIESAIGLSDCCPSDQKCKCASLLERLPENEVTQCTSVERVPPHLLQRAALQSTNYKGHSFVTRHLLFGIPHWQYKDHKEVVLKHLELLRDDLISLFHSGIELSGPELLKKLFTTLLSLSLCNLSVCFTLLCRTNVLLRLGRGQGRPQASS